MMLLSYFWCCLTTTFSSLLPIWFHYYIFLSFAHLVYVKYAILSRSSFKITLSAHFKTLSINTTDLPCSFLKKGPFLDNQFTNISIFFWGRITFLEVHCFCDLCHKFLLVFPQDFLQLNWSLYPLENSVGIQMCLYNMYEDLHAAC